MPLDLTLLARAAPPGSLRYFAQLYTPPEKRTVLLALFLIDAEIRESAASLNHDVAHTRLRWWRDEIERLVNRNAQHPATKVLVEQITDTKPFARLHEIIVAADIELARMTFETAKELRAYTERSGGVVTQLAGEQLATSNELGAATDALARVGGAIRETEIIRDLQRDSHAGRLFVPLARLDQHKLKIGDLQITAPSPAAIALVGELASQAHERLTSAMGEIPAEARATLRPLLVLGELHVKLLKRIERAPAGVFTQRVELSPWDRVWTAWRAARRSA
jgi:15-cis-phytoene synthase